MLCCLFKKLLSPFRKLGCFGGSSKCCSGDNSDVKSPSIDKALLVKFVSNGSVEVMPRTLKKVESHFEKIFPKNYLVYVAHIDGTDFVDMKDAVAFLVKSGFNVIPHIPARSVPDEATLEEWVKTYKEIGVSRALLLAGGIGKPRGDFESSLQLLDTGLFEKYGYSHIYVAGHPEGNKDIDPSGKDDKIMDFLMDKYQFAKKSGIPVSVTTQFCFEENPAYKWAKLVKDRGIDSPIHFGVAGPTKLNSLIKYSLMCGVGPSIGVLKRRALDMKNLIVPFKPDSFIEGLLDLYSKDEDKANLGGIHFFPLGGIKETALWIAEVLDDQNTIEYLKKVMDN